MAGGEGGRAIRLNDWFDSSSILSADRADDFPARRYMRQPCSSWWERRMTSRALRGLTEAANLEE